MRFSRLLRSPFLPGLLLGCGGDPGAISRAVDAAPPDAADLIFFDAGRASLAAQRVNVLRTVFVIVMAEKNWNDIYRNEHAPYINELLPEGSFASNYHGLRHPGAPNYIWLEAGSDLGLKGQDDPSFEHHTTTQKHLVWLLSRANISWRAYQEDIGPGCPVASSGLYAARHDPFVFFDDVTSAGAPTDLRLPFSPGSVYCSDHIRSYADLERDLASGNIARYNFITPNLCNDMTADCTFDSNDRDAMIEQGDEWLARTIPKIMATRAYKDGGVIFLLWDESVYDAMTCPNPVDPDCTIGLIVLSPFAKANEYTNWIAYDHSSTLKTIQTIFHLPPPYLGAAAHPAVQDLSDLFVVFP